MLQITTEPRATEPPIAGPLAVIGAMSPERVAVVTFLALTAGLLSLILARTGGLFVYSLDDPYIHVAIAERFLRGSYGINAGEVTSPSSSVIWPFLLVPTAWTPLGVHMPMILNTLLGLATAVLLGRFAATLDLPAAQAHAGAIRVAIAAGLVLATNLVGLAFTGLEHNLQVFIAVAVAVALLAFARGTALPDWALWLAALGPAVRYEMLALTAAVCLVLLVERQWQRMFVVGLGSLVLPAALALFLVANGNYPLPNSVMTKLGSGGAVGSSGLLKALLGGFAGLREYMQSNTGPKIILIAAIAVACWGAHFTTGRMRSVLAASIALGVLHLFGGQFGWFFRYEVYAIAFCGLVALALVSPRWPVPALAVVMLAATNYIPALPLTAGGAQNVYEQQYQMHRFVADHYRKSFAVNDLGWVSIGLPADVYVLDLWGLASNESVRQRDKSPEWMDEITRRHGVGLAMFYKTAFRGIPSTWTKAGELRLASRRVTASEDTVQIYVTATGDKAEIVRHLRAFAPTLPQGVVLSITE